MTNKQIKQLVLESYTKNNLDQKKIEAITKYLNRTELKEYIKTLKSFENQKNIIITLPVLPKEEEKNKFEALFPEKKIVYNIDPTLLAGIRIKNNDFITEMNLKDTLEDLLNHISQTYE